MKVVYDRDDDILMIEIFPNQPIDHAEHVGSVIAHFDPQDRLVLLEILDASVFIGALIQASLKGQAEVTVGAPAG